MRCIKLSEQAAADFSRVVLSFICSDLRPMATMLNQMRETKEIPQANCSRKGFCKCEPNSRQGRRRTRRERRSRQDGNRLELFVAGASEAGSGFCVLSESSVVSDRRPIRRSRGACGQKKECLLFWHQQSEICRTVFWLKVFPLTAAFCPNGLASNQDV